MDNLPELSPVVILEKLCRTSPSNCSFYCTSDSLRECRSVKSHGLSNLAQSNKPRNSWCGAQCKSGRHTSTLQQMTKTCIREPPQSVEYSSSDTTAPSSTIATTHEGAADRHRFEPLGSAQGYERGRSKIREDTSAQKSGWKNDISFDA